MAGPASRLAIRPGGPIYGIELTNDGLVSFGGGLPITDVRGRVVGAAL